MSKDLQRLGISEIATRGGSDAYTENPAFDGYEGKASSGIVRAVGEFAIRIGQKIGVSLSGRPSANEAFYPMKDGAQPAGQYFAECAFETCYLESNDTSGYFKSIRKGQRYFEMPQFYFVKPL